MIGNMYKFYTDDIRFSIFNGCIVRIIEDLDPPIIDAELGQLFHVETVDNGSKWHVYADELKPL